VNELALYVGNLSWETTEEAVAEVFGSFNPSDVSLKMGRNGRSRGWAIVAFQTADAAQSALDAMHGFEVDGRELQCRFDEGTGLKSRASRSTRTPRQEFSPPSTNSLYIGNLANATSSDDLFNWFVENNLNVVSADVVQSRGGRSQGYAIAVFQDTEDATNAINLLNGQEFMDRVVVLREDRGSSRPAAAQNAAPSEFALYVGNLSWNTTEEDVVEAFGQFNPTEVSLKIGRNGRSRGFAIATFQSTEEAQTALDSMDGFAMDGRELRLKFDRA
jgi:RNA recognition motif-containing protein